MAKDGSSRGGARIGAGRKAKALTEKIENGNPGHMPMMIFDLPEAAKLSGEVMPEPSEYLRARQRNGGDLEADKIYRATWKWLRDRGCEHLISQQLLEQYAMSVARWIQCEEAISEYGFLSKHPTTGAAWSSPYVSMSQSYMKQVNQIWFQIFQVVKENCTTEYKGNAPHDDAMEMLLRSRK